VSVSNKNRFIELKPGKEKKSILIKY
jgi:hypothetical protein